MTEETATPVASAPGSLMERMREKHRVALANKHHDMPIPQFGGELVCRYKLLDPLTDGKEITDRIIGQFKDDETALSYYGLVDLLIEACIGFYVRGDDGNLVLLDPDEQGPITYNDPRLAAFLGIDAGDPPSARNVLLGVFADNKVAARAQGQQLNEWMADPAGDARLGER